MGNCALQKHSKTGSMNSKNAKSIRHVSTGVLRTPDRQNNSTKRLIQSPISDQGDRCVNWVRESPRGHSRIPVRSSQFRKSTLSKSTSFIRSASHSRIPVVNARPRMGNGQNETDPAQAFLSTSLNYSHSQMNESGFVSDLSVTTSSHSQVTGVPRSIEVASGVDDACQLVQQSPSNGDIEGRAPLPSDSCQRSQTTTLVSDRFESRQKALRKQLSDVSIRRPHSLSCESEMLAQRLRSKRLSDVASPANSNCQESCLVSPRQLDSCSVLQDVSQLKLMLHKLRRSLMQEHGGESGQYDSLARRATCSPTSSDIVLMSREELEQKYENLLARNNHLEKLLQFREQVISQLQSERDCPNCNKSETCRSPLYETVDFVPGGTSKFS